MNKNIKPLCHIPIGERVTVCCLYCNGSIRRRLLDLGLVPGTGVDVLFRSPAGNPTAYRIRGAVIALRNEDAADILVM